MAWLNRRRQQVLAAVLAVALLAPVTVAALRAPGFAETKVNLHDGGVWVLNRLAGQVGRINTQLGIIEVKTRPPAAGADVVQDDSTVVLADTQKMEAMDPSILTMGGGGDVGGGGVQLGGPTGAAWDARGRVWVRSRDQITTVRKSDKPTADLGAGVQVVTGLDGTVHAYGPGRTGITDIDATASVSSRSIDQPLRTAHISSIGSIVVLLGADGTLEVVGGKTFHLSGTRLRLQQPGPANDRVIVASDSELLSVSLSSGAVRPLAGDGGGDPAAPVWLDGCAYGAWNATGRYAQVCDTGTRYVTKTEVQQAFALSGRNDLVFRVNRRRVVLNDATTGHNLLFSPDQPPKVVNDWSEAQSKNERQDQQTQVVQTQVERCQSPPLRPKLVKGNSLDAATHPGRPVIVPVLDRVSVVADPCDVLRVELPHLPSAIDAQVVDDGSAIQVNPGAANGTIAIPFSVVSSLAKDDSGQPAAVTGDLTVQVVNGTPHKPAPQPDQTVVEAGKSVVHNVLSNDTDSQGDALTLVKVTADPSSADGQVQQQADGTIRYTAGPSLTERKLTYQVANEQGGIATSTLTIEVRAPGAELAPTARPDRVTAVTNHETRFDLLANDSDPNGDPLAVRGLPGAPSWLNASIAGAGELRINPTQAGMATFKYLLSDGRSKPVEGHVRVDVSDPSPKTTPIAVRDDVVVRTGVPALVDLTRNDIDPAGGVLGVTSITPDDPKAALTVELLEMHIVRIRAAAGFTEPTTVRYHVSNGSGSAAGVLVVRPYQQREGEQDLPPIANPDEASVRAGNGTSIPVVRNDVDPEGQPLTLLPISAAQQASVAAFGRLFVEHDELRFVASPDASGTAVTSYTVKDPGGNPADGQLTINVLPRSTPNQLPTAPRLDARVFQGKSVTVPVPVVGLDPDGDPVSLTDIASPPSHGTIALGPDSITYTPDAAYVGADSVGFHVKDPTGAPVTGVLRLVVAPRPDADSPPVAVTDTATVAPGGTRVIDVLANDSDPDADPLSLLTTKDGVTQPSAGLGHVEVQGNRVVYTAPASVPDAGTTGRQVSFTYVVSDGRGGTAQGLVTVSVKSDVPNQPPVARDDVTKAQLPGAVVSVPVLANDFDPDDPTGRLHVELLADASSAIAAAGATASIESDGSITIHVSGGGVHPVTFSYLVTDAKGASAQALVEVPVVASLPPDAEPDHFTEPAGKTVTLPVLDNDKPAGHLHIVKLGAPRGGTAELSSDGKTVSFTTLQTRSPGTGVSYLVEDDNRQTAWGTVSITVQGPDTPPTLQSTSVTLAAHDSRAVDLSQLAYDPDVGQPLTFKAGAPKLTSGQGITSSLSGHQLQVDAAADAKSATADIPVSVSDGQPGGEGHATVHVTVKPYQGPPPVAVDDQSKVDAPNSVSLDLTLNDVDPLGTGLKASLAGSAAGGNVSVAGDSKTFTFTPAPGFHGVASVAYKVVDATNQPERTSSATWRINVISAPDAPTAPTGTPQSNVVHLTWAQPNSNGAPIDHYTVTASNGATKTAPSNAVAFDGLANGQQYTFTVKAHNEAGDGPSSAPSSPLRPDQIPDMPSPPTVTGFGDRSLSIAWTPPHNVGSPISKYSLQNMNTGQVQDLGTATTYNWTGLQNGIAFTFEVQATNLQGPSTWSSASAGGENATPAGQPLAPVSVRAKRNDKNTSVGGSVDVSWVWTMGGAQGGQGNGSDAKKFRIVASGGASQTREVGGGERVVTFDGLTNGVDYTFSVYATTRSPVESPPGTASARPASKPARVAAPSAAEGDQQAAVSFAAPSSGGDPITSYDVQGSPGGGASGSGSPVTVGGLSNGTAYTFEVRACSDVACGDWSPASNSVTPFGSPGAVSFNGASRSGNSITYSWNAPDGNGRPIHHYVLSGACNGNTGATSAQCNGSYGDNTLTVSAVNSGGKQGPASSQTVTIPSPVASISPGSQKNATFGSCSGQVCHKILWNITNFNSSGTIHFDCFSGADRVTGYTQPDSNGNWSGEDFGGGMGYCIVGANESFSVTVSQDGGPSKTLSGTSDAKGSYSISN